MIFVTIKEKIEKYQNYYNFQDYYNKTGYV